MQVHVDTRTHAHMHTLGYTEQCVGEYGNAHWDIQNSEAMQRLLCKMNTCQQHVRCMSTAYVGAQWQQRQA